MPLKSSNGKVNGAAAKAILIEGVAYELHTVLAAAPDADAVADYAKFITAGSGVTHANMDADGDQAKDDGTAGNTERSTKGKQFVAQGKRSVAMVLVKVAKASRTASFCCK